MKIQCQRRLKVFVGLLLVTLLFACSAYASNYLPADLVMINGKIITVDSDFSIAEAVAIRGEKIVSVGETVEIKKLVGPKTRVIDLEGKTVTPGFIDGHAHMDREGLKYIYPSLAGATTKAEIIAIIRQEVQESEPGDWIVTMPIGQPPFYFDALTMYKNGEIPNRWELDQVAPDNPVYIRHIWGYWGQLPLISVANSNALEIAGIDSKTLDPWSGVQVEKDLGSGEPNGIFLEWSFVPTLEFNLLKEAPRFSHDHRLSALQESMEIYNSYGTTAVYEGHGIAPEVIRVYKDLWEKEALTVRNYLVLSPNWQASEDTTALLDWVASLNGEGLGDDMLMVGGVFVQYSGNDDVADYCMSASPYTAWASYLYDALSEEEFRELAAVVLKGGFRFNSIGAGGVTRILDVLESIIKDTPVSNRRVVLEHLDVVNENDLKRIKDLGITVTTIPVSMLWKSPRFEALAKSNPDVVVPLKAMIENGIPAVLSTDNVPPSMLFTIWNAVTRENRVTGESIAPSQKLTREQALRAATINGAYLLCAEDKIGSIEPGKLADLAVLNEDILTCPESKIKDIQVLMTMVGGKIVYQNESAKL